MYALIALVALQLPADSPPSEVARLVADFELLRSGECASQPPAAEARREADAAWSALNTRHAKQVFLRDLAARVSGAENDPDELLAIDLLGRFGGETEGVVDRLVACLDSPHEDIQVAALDALAAVGPTAKRAGPRIARLFAGGRFPPRLRDAAFGPNGAFDGIAADAEITQPLLIALLDSADESNVFEAIWHTATVPSAWHRNSELANRLASYFDKDVSGTYAALAAWRVGGDTDAIISSLRDHLAADGTDRQHIALLHIDDIGAPASAAVSAIERMLDEDVSKISPGVRIDAVRTLWKVTGREEPDVQRLRAFLRQPDWAFSAAKFLAEIGPAAKDAVPELTAMLRSGSELNRSYAADALGRIGEPAKSAIPVLIIRFETDLGSVRAAAAKALRRIGPDDPVVREAVDRHLRTAREHTVIPCTDFNRCWSGFVWVAQLHGRESVIVPMVREKLGEEVELDERLTLIGLIGSLGEKSEAAVPELTAQLRHDSKYVRQAAAESLGLIGPGARASLPALRALAEDEARIVRWQADDAIARIDRQ